ncbi:MAG TPA: DUF448 domain-containing protein [Campylobacteraceae bacterium]|nr:DUF448 domain-containing protein [Campylobacteraceae bacterium]
MNSPIRMCICCRQRFSQNELIRLQCIDKLLTPYHGTGRSFYLCRECSSKRDKKLLKALSRACKKEIKITDLESLLYG